MRSLELYRKHNDSAGDKQRHRWAWIWLWNLRKRLIRTNSAIYTKKQLLLVWFLLPFWLPFLMAENIEQINKNQARSLFFKYFFLNIIPFFLLGYCFVSSVPILGVISWVLFWGENLILLNRYLHKYYLKALDYPNRSLTEFLGAISVGVVFGILELISAVVLIAIILQFL